jgi:hypothetical protein
MRYIIPADVFAIYSVNLPAGFALGWEEDDGSYQTSLSTLQGIPGFDVDDFLAALAEEPGGIETTPPPLDPEENTALVQDLLARIAAMEEDVRLLNAHASPIEFTGRVSDHGEKLASAAGEYTVSRLDKGEYSVVFSTPRQSALYAVLLTPDFDRKNDITASYKDALPSGFTVETRRDNGKLSDAGFTFVVIGG